MTKSPMGIISSKTFKISNNVSCRFIFIFFCSKSEATFASFGVMVVLSISEQKVDTLFLLHDFLTVVRDCRFVPNLVGIDQFKAI